MSQNKTHAISSQIHLHKESDELAHFFFQDVFTASPAWQLLMFQRDLLPSPSVSSESKPAVLMTQGEGRPEQRPSMNQQNKNGKKYIWPIHFLSPLPPLPPISSCLQFICCPIQAAIAKWPFKGPLFPYLISHDFLLPPTGYLSHWLYPQTNTLLRCSPYSCWFTQSRGPSPGIHTTSLHTAYSSTWRWRQHVHSKHHSWFNRAHSIHRLTEDSNLHDHHCETSNLKISKFFSINILICDTHWLNTSQHVDGSTFGTIHRHVSICTIHCREHKPLCCSDRSIHKQSSCYKVLTQMVEHKTAGRERRPVNDRQLCSTLQISRDLKMVQQRNRTIRTKSLA